MVRPVTTEAQVDGLSRLEVLLPARCSDAVKIVRDRVTHHQEVDLTLAHLGDLLGVPGAPPLDNTGLGCAGRALLCCLG